MGRRRGRRQGADAGPHGLVVLDKPAGMTSFTATQKVQRAFGAARAGHTGTLDPSATGVLVVLLGEGTKLCAWAVEHDKSYRATVRFGTGTDTLDAEGEVVARAEVPAGLLTEDRVRAALSGFVGAVMQVPPRFSALKRDGKRNMERARAGEDFDVPARPVVCHALALVELVEDAAVLDVACGRGYYVRSLARDLGRALGIPAHLAGLRRTSVGHRTLDESVSLGDLADETCRARALRPMTDAIDGLLTVALSAADATAVFHGRSVPAALGDEGQRAVLLSPSETPLAMAERVVAEGGMSWRVVRGLRVVSQPPQTIC